MLKRIRRMTKIRNHLLFILPLELPLLELVQITHLETVGSRLRSTTILKHSRNRFATCHLSMHNTASGSYSYTTMLLSSLTVCPIPEDAPENIPPLTLTEWCKEIKLPEDKIKMIFDNVFMNKRSCIPGHTFRDEVEMTARPLERDPYVTAFWMLSGDVDKKDFEEILREGCALFPLIATAATNNEVFQTIDSRFKQATLEHTRSKFEMWNSIVSQHVDA